MENILLGILGGGIATVVNWILLNTAALPIFKRSFRRTRLRNRKKAFKKLARLFSPQINHRMLGWFIGGTAVPGLAVWLILFPSLSAIAVGIPVFVGSMAAVWYKFGKKEVIRVRARMALAAIEVYIKDEDTTDLPDLLRSAAVHPDEAVRACAMEALGHWGAEEALPFLEKGTEDQSPLVREYANKNYHQVLRLTGRKKLYGVRILDELIRYIEELKKREFGSRSKDSFIHVEKRGRVEDTLKKILHTHKHLRNQYPHLICVNCRTTTQLVTKNGWEYLRCRNCTDVNGLLGGVEFVVGMIGAEQPWHQEGTTLFLDLWDDSGKKARFADIDELQIQGGSEINYDWAINAVLEVLRNGAMHSDWKVPVKFRDKPQLTHEYRIIDQGNSCVRTQWPKLS